MSAVFFTKAVIGENLRDEPGTNGEAELCELRGDLVHVQIGLIAAADDERLELFGAFRRGLWPCSLGQQVRRQPVEDGLARIVVGLARLETEGLGQFNLRQIAEFAQSDHADLLLDRLLWGEADGFALPVGENEGTVFDADFDIDGNIHLDSFP